MDYNSLISKAREFLVVDATRLNVGVVTSGTSFVDNMLRAALIDLQQFIDAFRVGHETVYKVDDVILDGQASVGSIPSGAAVTEAWYTKTGVPANRQFVGSYDWRNRFDLTAGRASLQGCEYALAMDPKSPAFMLFPKLEEGRQLSIFWNGLKLEFAPTDELPALMDEKCAECIADYASAHVERTVNKDLAMYQSYMSSYATKRRGLYSRAIESQHMSQPVTKSAPTVCTVCTPIQPDDTAIEFVLFGDSGDQSNIAETQAAADLLNRLEPDFVIHAGDAAYPNADAFYIQDNFVKFYSNWIERELLYLTPGNHDLDPDNAVALLAAVPYLAALNAGKAYYQFTRGPADIFVLNGNLKSTGAVAIFSDGAGVGSAQDTWLTAALANSTNYWKIVVLHHSPYTSDLNHSPGETVWRLDYKGKGAHVVLAAHGHSYERCLVNGFPYFTCGLGGAPRRGYGLLTTGSQFRYNSTCGVLKVTADSTRLQVTMINVLDQMIDNVVIRKP